MPSRKPTAPAKSKIALIPLNPDPVASLRVWGADVELGGQVFHVPARDAADWLTVLLADDLDLEAIFPGFCGPDVQVEVNQMLIDGTTDSEQLEKALCELLEEISGRRWWITVRLSRVLRMNWEIIGGLLASQGVVPTGVSLSYWLDGAYMTLLNHLAKNADQPQKVTDFCLWLVTAPASVAREQRDEIADSQAFLAAMRASR